MQTSEEYLILVKTVERLVKIGEDWWRLVKPGAAPGGDFVLTATLLTAVAVLMQHKTLQHSGECSAEQCSAVQCTAVQYSAV